MQHADHTPICSHCGQTFQPKRKHRRQTQRYCSYYCAQGPARETAETRFWERVDRSGDCWLWIGYTSGNNHYGRLEFRGRAIAAHRLAWELTHGAIPDGMSVCHRCDTPRCCNPAHLFLDTHAGNMADMAAKGRAAPQAGEQSHTAKLTKEAVVTIRRLHREGVAQRELGRRFGVSQHGIYCIVHRKTWRNV